MTTKHFLPFLAIAFFLVNSLSAQHKLGVKVEYGLNQLSQQSKFLVGPNASIEYQLSTKDVTPTQSIGLYSYFQFGNLFVQPEALFSSYSVSYNLENFTDFRNSQNSVSPIREKIQQIDLPIYAGVRIKNVKLGAGPVFHVAETISSELSDYEHFSIAPTKLSAGMQAGIGIDLKYVILDIKYNVEFNQTSDHIQYRNNATGLKSNISGLKVGLAFAL